MNFKQTLIETMHRTTENQKSCNELPVQLQQSINKVREQYGDAAQFLCTFNKDIQPLVAKCAERAYLGTAPSISLAQQTYSSDVVIAWIMAQLENLNDFAGVTHKLSIQQMEELAVMIMTEHHYLKVTELHLFLFRLKAGRYGQFYGVVDPMRIMDAMAQFQQQRIGEISTYERQRQQSHTDRLRQQWEASGISRTEHEQLNAKQQPTNKQQ